MRLIGWAIALAAAGLTPAAAQAPRARPADDRRGDDRDAAAGTAQDATKPDAAQPPIVYGSVGHMIPTPGIGEPDGRKGIQDQVTPIGRGGRRLPQQLAADRCARSISVFVLGLLLYAMVRFRRSANPMPSRNSHNTADRGDLDAGAGADPGRRSRSRRSACCATNIAAAGRRDGQGHRPPMVLDLRISRQWRSSFDSYMLKEESDPTRQANQRSAPTPTARRCSRSTSGWSSPPARW